MQTKNYNKDILEWDEFPAHDIVWADPPWMQRALKMFETMMFKATGKARPGHDIHAILGHFAKLVPVGTPCFIDYDKRGPEEVHMAFVAAGHKHTGTYTRTQKNGNPFVILTFNTDVVPYDGKGFEIITQTLRAFEAGKTVFDPFAGLGLIAKAVRAAGHTYIGSEINAARYAKLLKNNP